jgi:hypothetical protein
MSVRIPRLRVRVVPPYSTADALEQWERDRLDAARGSSHEDATPESHASVEEILADYNKNKWKREKGRRCREKKKKKKKKTR